MRGMILAAGRGGRMKELTDNIPKPLVRLGDQYLIEYSLRALIKFGIKEVIINVCYRGDQIKAALGDGSRYGVSIQYSEEAEALETGGGIFQALPLLGTEPFVALSCDVVTDYPLSKLPSEPSGLAHLVLVNNPSYHPNGDFCLRDGKVYYGQAGVSIENELPSLRGAERRGNPEMSTGLPRRSAPRNDGSSFSMETPGEQKSTLTFANIGVYRPELFSNCSPGKFRLGHLLQEAALNHQVTGEHYQGRWYNIGTAEDLKQLVL